MLASKDEQYINIVKIEDLARLMAGGDVFATHKKKDKRAGFLGGYCGNMWGRTGVNCSAKNLCRWWCRIAMCVVGKIETLWWHSAFPELRVWYSRRGFVRTKKIVKK